jgi:hypothetical protein
MPKSTYLDNTFLNIILTASEFTPPSGVYLALYTVAPGVGGGGTEVVSGVGYGRQTVSFSTALDGQSANTAAVVFPIATGPWGTIVAFGLLDASSGGNLLYFGTLSASRAVLTMDQVNFPIGQLIAQES